MVDNQHKQIKGYRDLSPVEIALMNDIKEHAERTRELIERISGATTRPETPLLNPGDKPVEAKPLADPRWVAIARTELQQGYMALTRAIAQPTTF